MRFLSLAAIASALCLLPAVARADDTPPPPPGNTATQNDPSNPTNPSPDAGGKTNARKEDEDETAGLLARLKAWGTGKNALADNLATVEKKLAAAEKKLGESESARAALQAENDQMRADLAKFATWLEANGHTTAKEATADPATAFQTAVGTGVAAEVRRIGIPAATVKTKPADGSAATLADIEEQLKACKTPAERQALLTKNKALILASN